MELSELAAQIHVSEQSLQRLGVSRNGTCWLIIERSGDGEIIGKSKRFDDGQKGFVSGGHRGLTMTWPLDPNAGGVERNPVLVVEGMTDTAAGMDMGFDVIGRASADGGVNHLRVLLKDRHVCIVGENDGGGADDPKRPGKRGAEKIAQALVGVALSVKIIYPPAGYKDLRAWFTSPASVTQEEVLTLIRQTPRIEPTVQTDPQFGLVREPVLVNLADVQSEPVRWLWPNRIALGKLTMLAGDPGLGKSFITLDIAARVSRGDGWPDAPEQMQEPGGVVLLSAEDDIADTIKPRLEDAGADSSRIVALKTTQYTDPKTGKSIQCPVTLNDIATLEMAIQQTPNCKLVIIDPVSCYLGSTDSHKNSEVRVLLTPLSEMAARCGVALLVVTHLNKGGGGGGGGSALYRATGSLAFVAAARAAWLITEDKNDPTKQRRLMLPLKNNIGKDETGLAYRLDSAERTASITWEDAPVTIKAEDALAPHDSKPGPESESFPEAVQFLRDTLANGPRLAKDVQEEATHTRSISKRTLDRAKRGLGVEAYRDVVPGPWSWRLPQHCQESADCARAKYLGDLGNLAGNTANRDGSESNIAKIATTGILPMVGYSKTDADGKI